MIRIRFMISFLCKNGVPLEMLEAAKIILINEGWTSWKLELSWCSFWNQISIELSSMTFRWCMSIKVNHWMQVSKHSKFFHVWFWMAVIETSFEWKKIEILKKSKSFFIGNEVYICILFQDFVISFIVLIFSYHLFFWTMIIGIAEYWYFF